MRPAPAKESKMEIKLKQYREIEHPYDYVKVGSEIKPSDSDLEGLFYRDGETLYKYFEGEDCLLRKFGEFFMTEEYLQQLMEENQRLREKLDNQPQLNTQAQDDNVVKDLQTQPNSVEA